LVDQRLGEKKEEDIKGEDSSNLVGRGKSEPSCLGRPSCSLLDQKKKKVGKREKKGKNNWKEKLPLSRSNDLVGGCRGRGREKKKSVQKRKRRHVSIESQLKRRKWKQTRETH